MKIFNVGSVNADFFYAVPHLPRPGETVAAGSMSRGLGGKGANQSVAIAKAGLPVHHIGAVGADGQWMLDALSGFGVDVSAICQVDGPSGHAIINVSEDGENEIVLMPGSNRAVPLDHIKSSLDDITPDDWLILQNEVNGTRLAAEHAKAAGAKVVYSAAPFDVGAICEMLPFIDVLAVNEGEAKAMYAALGSTKSAELESVSVLKTLGSDGAEFLHQGTAHRVDGRNVQAVDTTAAGDTFLGYFISAYAQGQPIEECLTLANGAAALKVTRPGTADAIPRLSEVLAFIS